jgi:hypothetical protein
VYWVKNNQIIVTEGNGYIEIQMSGDYYDPDYGYAVLSTEAPIKIYDGENYPSSGVLVVTGEAGSGDCNTGARLEFFPSLTYHVTADTYGDCVYDDYDSGVLIWQDG